MKKLIKTIIESSGYFRKEEETEEKVSYVDEATGNLYLVEIYSGFTFVKVVNKAGHIKDFLSLKTESMAHFINLFNDFLRKQKNKSVIPFPIITCKA
jgi:hypothetical protein